MGNKRGEIRRNENELPSRAPNVTERDDVVIGSSFRIAEMWEENSLSAGSMSSRAGSRASTSGVTPLSRLEQCSVPPKLRTSRVSEQTAQDCKNAGNLQ